MLAVRGEHSATTLQDGRILLAGGDVGTTTSSTAEIYDPSTGSFTSAGRLNHARSGHLAFLLPDNNQVLIVGGVVRDRTAAVAEALRRRVIE